jgi:transketolase C-terminal domain/subunit
MPGYDVAKTLAGHGITANVGDGEDLDQLFVRIQKALIADGPVALINKRLMAVGVAGIEGSPKGHDVISAKLAIDYLTEKGLTAAALMLQDFVVKNEKITYLGSSPEMGKVRDDFGKVVSEILDGVDNAAARVLVVDSDLEGSCGLHHIRKNHPEVYVHGGIMERNNFSVAAGFGSEAGRQGIYGTFAAFLEMVVSEITMARLNHANVLAHFSHSGIDDMADNTCHFGINNFFADNAVAEGDVTRLYFPADVLQLRAMLKKIFNDKGLRFVFSTRSATPSLLDDQGRKIFGDGYVFQPGKDEVIREGNDGYIISYGEMTYRCLDAVLQLKAQGQNIGLINKPTLNVIDEEMIARAGSSPFVLVVESQNTKTGLGMRYGTWLLERGLSPKYSFMGTNKLGHGGIAEQLPHQGLAVEDIKNKILSMHV